MPKPTVIACVSDLHAGSAVALCPPSIALDDGGTYLASKVQRWLWQCWGDYWARVEGRRRSLGARFVVVLNGDLVDGQVKESTQVLSGNPNAQAAVLNAALKIPLDLEPDHIIIVRGTEAHVGKSACSEERIADGLRRDKRPIISDPDTGNAAWWHFRGDIDGVQVDITHHGKSSGLEMGRAAAAARHAHEILLAHVKDGHRWPDLALRGHHHKFNDSNDACPVRVVTSGAWQLGTSHVHKIAADSLADIGGLIVTVSSGKADVEKVKFQADRGPVVCLTV